MTKYPGGRYLVVFNMEEARLVCDYIERTVEEAALRERFGGHVSPGFDFSRDLVRVGLANQTTMLAGESLAIAEEFRQCDDPALRARYDRGSLPQLRHHLFRHPGTAGCPGAPAG